MASMPVAHDATAQPGPAEALQRIEVMQNHIRDIQAKTRNGPNKTLDLLMQKLDDVKFKIAAGGVGALALAQGAAAEVNWTVITDILDGIANEMLPSFLALVTAAVPLLIVLAVVGFVMKFLDKILDMLQLR